MENNDTIGAILIQERQRRKLSLDDIQEATKITSHNLAALEEDRFDHFPNRVYARAFLRDYANFLGLDSTALLEKYEVDWQPSVMEAPVVLPRRRSPWKAIAVTLLVLAVLSGLAAVGYFYDKNWGVNIPAVVGKNEDKTDVAQLPKPEPIVPADTQVEKPKPKPEPAEPAPKEPVEPRKLVLEVTAVRPVWADIRADGKKIIYGMLPAGIKTVEAKEKVFIKVGQANAVSLKLNGEPQEPLGTKANMGKREFVLPPEPVSKPEAGTPAPAVGSETSPESIDQPESRAVQ